MGYNLKLLPRCGAKARSRGGEPCMQACVMNGTGRCHYHGGASNIKHGLYTKMASEEARQVRELIKDSKKMIANI